MMNDLRLAIRGLARRPSSTLLAILALALGIGANAAILSFVEGIVLKPLPYENPDRLIQLRQTSGMRTTSLGAVSPRDLEDFRALNDIFAGLAGTERDGKNVSFAGSPERLVGLAIDSSYFNVLGVTPAIGRAFATAENETGNDTVVILSDRLFARRWNRDPQILERSVLMNGRAHRIVGVMPAGFRTPDDLAAIGQIDYFVPQVIEPSVRVNRGEHILDVIGRLQPGVTIAQANAALDHTSARIAASDPSTSQNVKAIVGPLQEFVSGSLPTPMILLFCASALIFFIAAVNVASLLAARAVEESREVAVRVALGASKGRVVRESMVRSLLLAFAGCALGLLTAFALKSALLSIAPPRTPRLEEISIDAGVVGGAMLLSVAGAALFGLMPAFLVSRAQATSALRSGGRAGSPSGLTRGRAALVTLEIALAVLPLVGATLMIRSLAALRGVDLGFETDQVLVANLPLPEGRYATGDARFAFFESVAERARALPGVEAVGFANRFPMRGGWGSGIQFDGEGQDTFHDVGFQAVGGDYFKALGIPLQRGRALGSRDVKGAPPVAVVNQRFVTSFLKGDPIGQRLRRGADRPWISIVGVVADIRRDGKTGEVEPQAYLSAAQTDLYPVRLADIALRSRVDPSGLIRPLQDVVWSVDAEQPLMNVRTLSETVDTALSLRRFQTLLLAMFAGLALLLALIGVYGVVTTTVARRTQEIGIRMALGARAGAIARMVVSQSMRPALVGMTVGIGASVFAVRAMSSLVFGVNVLDPGTFAAVPAVLLAAVAAASLIPAMRASKVEPSTALRDE